LIFGVAPALRATAVDPMAELKTRGGARPRTPRGLLITAQVAMSLTLLVGAALFIRSLRAGLTTDIGFDPRPLSAVSIEPGLTGSTKERTQWFYANVLGEAQRIRGVTGVAISDHVPLADVLSLGFTTGAPAQMPALGADSKEAGITTITPEFFEVLGIPLIAGRPFSTADRADGPKVAMLNESASRLFFGERSPLGHTVNFLGAMSYTVIGVVRDIKYESVRDDRRPMVYFSMSQESVGAANVIVRSRDPKSALAGLRRTLAAVDPNVPTHDGRAVADQIDEVLMPQRFGSTLLGAFAIIALLVSVVGIYGVIAYIVAQRSSEIGIRIALGAQAADVLRLVLANTGIAVAVGFVVGMGGAAIASRALSRFLFGVGALDATAFVVAGAAFAAAAIAATVVPARRAVRVDPASAMRSD
jgi:predicted permease